MLLHFMYPRINMWLIGDSSEISAQSWINSPAPPTLAGFKGNVVVLEFFATWCGPCRSATPHLVKLFNDNYNRGLRVVGLTNEADYNLVYGFASELKVNYPVGVGSRSGLDYSVSAIPKAFLLDRSGTVIWSGHPMSGLDAALEKALASQ